ncbi:hypothetical protein P153DRAFT_196897 [Dothidotthia symphoricarpi CBS 119687]|uniref:Uncharacterized protein n=1 Tax=Dothidotthia symphoricarpi CBS 119687 TaxID=1392245 RepID=A0A6A6AIV8_9PLEO|nr:uncharacterized protein P153DRAFT_196897 [Dothidotthia symphoricarpi CBS 119687]KAF2131496.1 hypothetical protein P153DRAFT_196897 [Dothidotthia symphoricarpi CBS 119687]
MTGDARDHVHIGTSMPRISYLRVHRASVCMKQRPNSRHLPAVTNRHQCVTMAQPPVARCPVGKSLGGEGTSGDLSCSARRDRLIWLRHVIFNPSCTLAKPPRGKARLDLSPEEARPNDKLLKLVDSLHNTVMTLRITTVSQSLLCRGSHQAMAAEFPAPKWARDWLRWTGLSFMMFLHAGGLG